MASVVTARPWTTRADRAIAALVVGGVGVAAYASARASVLYHRHHLAVVPCDATPWNSSEPCEAALPMGGWPRPYLIDLATNAGAGTLGPDDGFHPGTFAVDVAAFALIWTLVVLVWSQWRARVTVAAAREERGAALAQRADAATPAPDRPRPTARRWPVFVVLIALVALVTTLASGLIEGSYLAAQGNLCRPSPLNPGYCYQPLPTAGWPVPYLFDTPGVSVTGQVSWAEDDVHAVPFIVDLALFTLAWALVLLRLLTTREKRRLRRADQLLATRPSPEAPVTP